MKASRFTAAHQSMTFSRRMMLVGGAQAAFGGLLVADGPGLEYGVYRLRRGHGHSMLCGPADNETVQSFQFHAAPGH